MYECVYSVTVYGPHLRHSRGHCYVRYAFLCSCELELRQDGGRSIFSDIFGVHSLNDTVWP